MQDVALCSPLPPSRRSEQRGEVVFIKIGKFRGVASLNWGSHLWGSNPSSCCCGFWSDARRLMWEPWKKAGNWNRWQVSLTIRKKGAAMKHFISQMVSSEESITIILYGKFSQCSQTLKINTKSYWICLNYNHFFTLSVTSDELFKAFLYLKTHLANRCSK